MRKREELSRSTADGDVRIDMALTEFGPFAVAFEEGELDVPGYLKLLHLHTPEAQIVIDHVELALSAGDPARWGAALFRDANWRPHLVGATRSSLPG
ncbi:hypothetical protein BE11_14680 [Sorangium cellulosum]|nr:hypothetical protein BE11_14680 [Sorangium cellulosum]